jgi:hypothetical protein
MRPERNRFGVRMYRITAVNSKFLTGLLSRASHV